MTEKELAKLLAIFNKLKIEFNLNLNSDEKELLKQLIDEKNK